MAYERHEWVCGEKITAELMNNLEGGVEEALAGGSGDCGYECTETVTTLTEESVTTVASEEGNTGQFSYSQLIDADTIKVTFNGTEYECSRMQFMGMNVYGGLDTSTGSFDFSQYPFAIASLGSESIFATETAGTYTVKIEAEETIVTTTPCFDKARGYSCSETTEVLDDETVTTFHDRKGNFNRGDLNNFHLEEAVQKLTITFDNVEYECTYNGDDTYGSISNVDFPIYPFRIHTNGTIYTSTDGEHSVKIEAVQEAATTTSCFEMAVANVLSSKLKDQVVPFAIDQNVTINAKSRGTIHLGVAGANPIPSSYISRALQNVRLDPNYPALVMRGCVIANDYAIIDVYNTGDSNISLTAGNDSNSIDVAYLCVE